MTLVILSATSKYRVKTMNLRIVDMRRSFPLSDTFPKLQKKSNLDKFCKRYGWIYQLPRQHLPAATCEFIAKSATSRLFQEKVPSLPRIILRTCTRIRTCRQFSQRDWMVWAVTTADVMCGFNTPKWGFLSKLALWWFSSILESIYIYLWDRKTTTGPNGVVSHSFDVGNHRRSRWRGTCGRMHIFLDRTTGGHLCSSRSCQLPKDDWVKWVRC